MYEGSLYWINKIRLSTSPDDLKLISADIKHSSHSHTKYASTPSSRFPSFIFWWRSPARIFSLMTLVTVFDPDQRSSSEHVFNSPVPKLSASPGLSDGIATHRDAKEVRTRT